jgi:hypothetical protein
MVKRSPGDAGSFQLFAGESTAHGRRGVPRFAGLLPRAVLTRPTLECNCGSAELGAEALWGDELVAFGDEPAELFPVDIAIEADADPAFRANVLGHEEALGVCIDEDALGAGRSFDGEAGLRFVDHDEELVADTKAGAGVAAELLFLRFWQGQADLAQALDRVVGLGLASLPSKGWAARYMRKAGVVLARIPRRCFGSPPPRILHS